VWITTSTFATAASASVNSCFSATYDNYLLIVNITAQSSTGDLVFRLRVGGVDASTNYEAGTWYVASNNTSAALGATAQAALTLLRAVGVQANDMGCQVTVFRPAVADQTHVTSIGSSWRTDNLAIHGHNGGSHRTATAYDGFTLLTSAGTMTGSVQVYGLRTS
jgi:hypothetical protein